MRLDDDAAEVESPPIVPVDLDAGRPPIDTEAEHALRGREPLRGHRERRRAPCPARVAGAGVVLAAVAPAIGHPGLGHPRCDCGRLARRFRAGYAADRLVLCLDGLPVNLRGLDFDGVATTTEQHEGVPILVVQGNIVNERRQDRRTCRICGSRSAMPRRQESLFVDRRAAARDAAAGRGGRLPHAGLLRRRRTPTTCWCASSIATTLSTGTR